MSVPESLSGLQAAATKGREDIAIRIVMNLVGRRYETGSAV